LNTTLIVVFEEIFSGSIGPVQRLPLGEKTHMTTAFDSVKAPRKQGVYDGTESQNDVSETPYVKMPLWLRVAPVVVVAALLAAGWLVSWVLAGVFFLGIATLVGIVVFMVDHEIEVGRLPEDEFYKRRRSAAKG
jgi:hypothetical protein